MAIQPKSTEPTRRRWRGESEYKDMTDADWREFEKEIEPFYYDHEVKTPLFGHEKGSTIRVFGLFKWMEHKGAMKNGKVIVPVIGEKQTKEGKKEIYGTPLYRKLEDKWEAYKRWKERKRWAEDKKLEQYDDIISNF